MNIIFDEEIDVAEKLVRQMTEAAEICVGEEGLDPHFCEVSFSFADEEEIRRLNAAYRDKDAVTDVLSFPQYDDLRELDNEEEICLGDAAGWLGVRRRNTDILMKGNCSISLFTAFSISWATIIWKKRKNGRCASEKSMSWKRSD